MSAAAIRNALIAKLLADATLMQLVPDGVYYGEAGPGKKRFVIVALKAGHDEPMFGGRAWEDRLYLVKAVMLSTSGGDIAAAEQRIDDLLDPDGAGGTLDVAGYKLMTLHREEPLDETERDDVDQSIWQHRGGLYRCIVSG